MGTWYRTGTVSVTNGSTAVVGVQTLWTTQASQGDLFTLDAIQFYEIDSITDDTHLTLKSPYTGSTASAQNYAIIRNFTATLPAKLAAQLAQLMTDYHGTLDELTAWLSGTGTVTVHDGAGNAYEVKTPAQLASESSGLLSKSVAGGTDVTLTTTEAANSFLDFTGTLTANINVIVPATSKRWIVRNSTTGAYTVTVKTASGTGKVVTQGKVRGLWCDGTNVLLVDTDAIEGVPIGQTTPAAGSFTTLTASDNFSFTADKFIKFLGNSWVGSAKTLVTGGSDNAIAALRGDNGCQFAGSGGELLATLNSLGNFGLGPIPNSWWSGRKVFEIGGSGVVGHAFMANSPGTANYLALGSNHYITASVQQTYLSNGTATLYEQAGGSHAWSIAPSGTAGNAISWKQVMTLDSNGRLGVGNTNPNSALTVGAAGSSGSGLNETIYMAGYSTTPQYRFIFNHGGSGLLGIGSDGAGSMIFGRAAASDGSVTDEFARFDGSGNLLVGASSGSNHAITKAVAVGATALDIQGGGALFCGMDASGFNAADAAFKVGKVTATSRSINAGGTVNASGADYAEYMTKSDSCGVLEKGQIVGVDERGKLTDKWSEAVSHLIKSTDPSYVGGDVWGSDEALGKTRPVEPRFAPPVYDGATNPGDAPKEPDALLDDATDEQQTAYATALDAYHETYAAWDSARSTYEQDQAAYAARVKVAKQIFDTATYPTYQQELATFNAALEAARKKVDRIAYAGQVPVNVTGASPGQYVVPVEGEDGSIAGMLVNDADITFDQYRRAVGIVQNILSDGRANVRVKVA